jgi:hypothetical protein
MGSITFLGFLFVIIVMGSLSSSQAHKFLVGGKDGWVLNPSENYNHWAERNRFKVNDTLCKPLSLSLSLSLSLYIYIYIKSTF